MKYVTTTSLVSVATASSHLAQFMVGAASAAKPSGALFTAPLRSGSVVLNVEGGRS